MHSLGRTHWPFGYVDTLVSVFGDISYLGRRSEDRTLARSYFTHCKAAACGTRYLPDRGKFAAWVTLKDVHFGLVDSIELPAGVLVRHCLAHGSAAVVARPSFRADTNVRGRAIPAVSAAEASLSGWSRGVVHAEGIEVTLCTYWPVRRTHKQTNKQTNACARTHAHAQNTHTVEAVSR